MLVAVCPCMCVCACLFVEAASLIVSVERMQVASTGGVRERQLNGKGAELRGSRYFSSTSSCTVDLIRITISHVLNTW